MGGPGTWALSPLVGTPWRVWGETVENFHNNHEYKKFYIILSAPWQQNKRLCPGWDDIDTDTNT